MRAKIRRIGNKSAKGKMQQITIAASNSEVRDIWLRLNDALDRDVIHLGGPYWFDMTNKPKGIEKLSF